MSAERALITGITGQVGQYLARHLLELGYEVSGLRRHRSSPVKLDGLDRVRMVEGDMTDSGSLTRALKLVEPDHVYNLAAQSFVGASWDQAEHTAEVNAMGTLRLLEAVRQAAPGAKFYQASSSEMYGNASASPQDEETAFNPVSPYGTSKLFAHNIARNYRDSYGMYVVCGICFNHESPIRGEQFVTRHVTKGVAKIVLGLADELTIGNREARRDWGFAGDYVKAMELTMRQDVPWDYVIATGVSHSVEELLEEAFAAGGIEDYQAHLVPSDTAMRPNELWELRGDSSRIREMTSWKPETSFSELISMMVDSDLALLDGTIAT